MFRSFSPNPIQTFEKVKILRFYHFSYRLMPRSGIKPTSVELYLLEGPLKETLLTKLTTARVKSQWKIINEKMAI